MASAVGVAVTVGAEVIVICAVSVCVSESVVGGVVWGGVWCGDIVVLDGCVWAVIWVDGPSSTSVSVTNIEVRVLV